MTDPRVKWESPDGQYVVVDCADIPAGVVRSPNCFGVNAAASKDDKSAWRPHPGGSGGYYSKVLRADLPWLQAKASSLASLQKDPAPSGYTMSSDPWWEMPTPPLKKVAILDWPLPCPKCKRAQSAVLLLNDYDCKHGCYRRSTS